MRPTGVTTAARPRPPRRRWLPEWLRHGDAPVERVWLYGRAALWLGLLAYTPAFALANLKTGEVMDTWLYGVFFLFHEAGHLFFALLGDFFGVAGGTLMQLLMPLAVLVSFLWRGHVFGAAVAAWGLGASLATVAPYLYDATILELPLNGGITGAEFPEYHDWFNLLGRLGWLNSAQLLGRLCQGLADLVMVLSLAWGLLVLEEQRRAGPPAL